MNVPVRWPIHDGAAVGRRRILTRKAKSATTVCRNLQGENTLEKSRQTTAGMPLIFPQHLYSNT
jgi:hypothetical protein